MTSLSAHSLLAVAPLLFCLVAGCSGEGALSHSMASNSPTDAGNPDAVAPPPPDDPTAACVSLPKLPEGTLELLPEFVTVFSHSTASCDTPGSGVLVRNTGAELINITAIGVSSGFTVATSALPLTLTPGETARAVVRYSRTDNPARVDGVLRIMTSQGCTEFDVSGLATDEGLFTYSEMAVDFGTWAQGVQSEPRNIDILYQRNPDFYQAEFSGFSTDPPESFPMEAAPVSPLRPASCDSFRVSVRFAAQGDPGPVEGALLWRVQTDSPDGVAEATVFIKLYGTVR